MHNIDRVEKSNRFQFINNQVRGHCFKYFKEISRQQYREIFFFSIERRVCGTLCLAKEFKRIQSTVLKQQLIAG